MDIKIGKNASVHIVWRTTVPNIPDEEIEQVKSMFANKYGIKKERIRVEVKNELENGIVTSFNSENITNIHDPKYHQELFKVYLNERGNNDYDFDEILKIDSQVNSHIDYDKYEKGLKYNLKWIRWSNLLSYGKDNFFDFTKLKGIVNVTGKPANQSGKTTFADDIIHILLFGATNKERASKNGELFNRMLPNETVASIEGCITIQGQDYIIERTFTRAAKSKSAVRDARQDVHFYRLAGNGEKIELVDEESENLEGATTYETNKIIKETIGNEDDFNLIISANSKDLEDLISLKATDRGRMLTRWVGLSPIEDKESVAKEIWSSIKSKRLCNIVNREDLKADIELNKVSITENTGLISKSNETISSLNTSISNKEKDIETLLSSKRQINEAISRLNKVTIENRIKVLTGEGLKRDSEILSVEQKLSEYKEEKTLDEDEYDKILSGIEKLSEQRGELAVQYKNIRGHIDALKNGEYCPTCKRKYDNIDNSAAISEQEKELATITVKGKGISEELEFFKKRKELMSAERKYIEEKNKLMLSLSSLKVQKEQIKSELKSKQDDLSKLEECSESIKVNNEIDARVNVIKTNLSVDKRLLDEEKNKLAEYKNNIEVSKKKITEDEVNIKRIDEEVKAEKNWTTYLELVGKNGICKIVLRNTVPIINRKLNDILEGICDFKVEITVNEKDNVEFWLVRDGIYAKLSSASGMERTAAALALRVVLGNMSNLSRPPFIVLDEILGQVAEANYDNFRELYDRISKFYDFILHIAHANLDWNTQDILVVKENGISTVGLV